MDQSLTAWMMSGGCGARRRGRRQRQHRRALQERRRGARDDRRAQRLARGGGTMDRPPGRYLARPRARRAAPPDHGARRAADPTVRGPR